MTTREQGFPAGIAILVTASGLVLAIAVNAAYTSWAVRAGQATQRQQGVVVERKICTTMHELAALKPPPGNPAENPSRAYEDNLHTTLSQLGTDLGCVQ